MQLVIEPDGAVRCLYDESINLSALGRPVITRGSHVEPDRHGQWFADLVPCSGPRLGPINRRSEALAAERCWLENYYKPMQDSFKDFLDRNGNSEEARAIVEAEKREIELYEKYRDYYSYGVYIAKKVGLPVA